MENHIDIINEINLSEQVLKLFRNYLQIGYYPFFLQSKEDYLYKLSNVIEKVIYEDIAVTGNITQAKIPALKKCSGVFQHPIRLYQI